MPFAPPRLAPSSAADTNGRRVNLGLTDFKVKSNVQWGPCWTRRQPPSSARRLLSPV